MIPLVTTHIKMQLFGETNLNRSSRIKAQLIVFVFKRIKMLGVHVTIFSLGERGLR